MDNKYGIYWGCVFYGNFYGVNVLLQVNNVEWNKVYVYELKMKKIEEHKEIPIFYEPKQDGYCLLVPHSVHNGKKDTDKSLLLDNFIQEDENLFAEVNITEDMQIFKTAKRICEGTVEVKPGKMYLEFLDYYEGFEDWYYPFYGGEVTRKEAKENKKIDRVWEV